MAHPGGLSAPLTTEKEIEFLAHLRENGNVTVSARAVGFSRQVFYLHREANPEFAEAWDEALEEATEALEEEVRRRGQVGYLEPVFYQGVQTDTVRKYSDTLLIFLLKKRNPEFRDHANINLGGQRDNPVRTERHIPLENLDDEDRKTLQDLIDKALDGGAS